MRKGSGAAQRKIETTRRPSWPPDRIERARVDKFSARRIELAEAALETLAELGYARTSLREIAQKSEFTHGTTGHGLSALDMDCCHPFAETATYLNFPVQLCLSSWRHLITQ